MTDTLAHRLAARFRDDAQALRARASVLAARGANAPRGHGPNADASLAMADACDAVCAVLASAADDDALHAAIPELERRLAAERSPDAKHVYAGAVTRLRQSLGGGDEEPDDDDDLDDEEGDDE